MPTLDKTSALSKSSLESPCVLQHCVAMSEWIADSNMQKCMAGYAVSHKKEIQFKKDQRHYAPLKPKAGKEQTEKMFGEIMEQVKSDLVDISAVSENFASTSWIFGFSEKYQNASMTPNSAHLLRPSVLFI